MKRNWLDPVIKIACYIIPFFIIIVNMFYLNDKFLTVHEVNY